jgi:hypothetical protein
MRGRRQTQLCEAFKALPVARLRLLLRSTKPRTAAVALGRADPNGYGQALRDRDFAELELSRINRAIRRDGRKRDSIQLASRSQARGRPARTLRGLASLRDRSHFEARPDATERKTEVYVPNVETLRLVRDDRGWLWLAS